MNDADKRTPPYWEQAKAELAAADAVMGGIIAQYRGETLRSKGDAFYTLARAIVGQQISVKAADSVWAKLEAALETVSVSALLAHGEDHLRACGLSRQKIAYLRAIAAHFAAHGVGPGFFDAMSDEEAARFLVGIKGVGRWTAEMFLIFHLMRPDVFPVDDIGLQRGIERHYTPLLISPLQGGEDERSESEGDDKKQKLAAMHSLAEGWRPWRSVATWYLWRSLDPVPVEY